MPQPRKGPEPPDEVPAEGSPEKASSEFAELSFEASLERLEGVVDRLEQGDLELEASLEAFEEGVRLSARCSEQLASADQRIEILTREGGNWVSRPFASVDAAQLDDAGEMDDAADTDGEGAS